MRAPRPGVKSSAHVCYCATTQEFSEFDKQGAVLRRASNPIDFDDDGEAEEEGTSYDEEDDDLDFSGGGSGEFDEGILGGNKGKGISYDGR